MLFGSWNGIVWQLECIDRIFDAIVNVVSISKLLYASPSWSGYTNAEQFYVIRQLFVKAHTVGGVWVWLKSV